MAGTAPIKRRGSRFEWKPCGLLVCELYLPFNIGLMRGDLAERLVSIIESEDAEACRLPLQALLTIAIRLSFCNLLPRVFRAEKIFCGTIPHPRDTDRRKNLCIRECHPTPPHPKAALYNLG